jgi:hypothetical protein
MSGQRMQRIVVGVVLVAALTLVVPVPSEAAGLRLGKGAPDLWAAALEWVASLWAGEDGGIVSQDKKGWGIDPNGSPGSGEDPEGQTTTGDGLCGGDGLSCTPPNP